MFSISKISARQCLSLRFLSYLYLLLPLYIFAYFWFNAIFSLLFLIVICVAHARIVLPLLTNAEAHAPLFSKDNWKALALIAVVSLLWLLPSGFNGWGYQNYDFEKHNAMLKDLMENPWPIIYRDNIYLVYYFAFYLPAGFVAKFTNWQVANLSLFTWLYGGVFLSLCWVARLLPKKFFWLVIIFPFLSGMDVLGYYLVQGQLPHLGDHWEWWPKFAQFSSNTTLLFWVPQHAIPAWLTAAMFLETYTEKKYFSAVGILIAAVFLWSPFVALGLCIVLLPVVLRHWREVLVFENFALAPLLAFFSVIFISGNALRIQHGWLFASFDLSKQWQEFLLFYSFEFLLVGILAIYINACSTQQNFIHGLKGQGLFIYIILSLIFCTLYKMGLANDLTMRASVPVLFVFWIFVSRCLAQTIDQWRGGAKLEFSAVFFILFLILGAFTAISEQVRGLRVFPQSIPEVSSIKRVNEMEFSEQYLGAQSSLYSQYFAPNLPGRD